MSEIYFVRHGQASFGSEDYDRLSPLGVRQAQVLDFRVLSKHKPLQRSGSSLGEARMYKNISVQSHLLSPKIE